MNNEHTSHKMINQIVNVVFDTIKKWQIILFVTLLFGLGYDTYQSVTYVPYYTTQATFAIKTSNNFDVSEGDVGETFTYIFQSNIFKKKIQESMNVNYLNGYYSASTRESTNVLYVSATSTSIHTSYEMMKALIDNYKEVSSLVLGNTNIELVEDIVAPSYPNNSVNHKRNIVLFGAIGFILSSGILAALSFLKNTIKDKYDVESKLHLHLYGTLPLETKIIGFTKMGISRKKAILINQYSTSFKYIESVKRIRSRIERHTANHEGHKVYMVTSSLENEGKSSVAVNLALSLSQNNHKVIMIDGDFRKPSIHLILEKSEYNGWEEIITGAQTLDQCLVKINDHFDALLEKEAFEIGQDLIQSDKMKALFDELREKYDYIIIDSAPSRFLTDSSLLAEYADGILLVVKQNFAKVSTILSTIDRLTLSKTPIIGCVDNQVISGNILNNSKYYGYRYGYNHYYGKHHKKGEK